MCKGKKDLQRDADDKDRYSYPVNPVHYLDIEISWP